MKKISIAQRYRPFSHRPGATCLLPRTSFVVEAFPALLRVKNLFDLPLNHHGPVREFTLQQDLEKGIVSVWGIAKGGRFRLSLQASKDYIDVNGKKFSHSAPYLEPIFPLERLSLGNHQAKDWDLVLRRFDLREILPVLFHLNQWIPESGLIRSHMLPLLERDWESFLRAAFSKILTPRFVDDEYQGILFSEDGEGNPALLIKKAGEKIRALFFQQEGSLLRFIPASAYEVGRMTDVRVEGIGCLDFEWKKRALRQITFRAETDTKIRVDVPRPFSSFRLRTSRQEKGFRVQVNEELPVTAGLIYFFDRFQK